MTDKMIEKAIHNTKKYGYKNVFGKGDIEKRIPVVDDDSVNVVMRSCVINLTFNKVDTFREIYRILKPNGFGRMVISDLVTDREIVRANLINAENWCRCIDGALTKERYIIESIKEAGFSNVKVLDEKPYLEMDVEDERKIDYQPCNKSH